MPSEDSSGDARYLTLLGMRQTSLLVLTILLSSMLARAQTLEGQSITVAVEGAPAGTSAVICDLAADCRGLELSLGKDGTWVGSFAVLPHMVNGMIRPEVSLLDANGRRLPRKVNDGLIVGMASSELDQDSLASVLEDESTVIVFGDNIAADSIRITTHQGAKSFAPQLGTSTFSACRRSTTLSVMASAVMAFRSHVHRWSWRSK